MASPPRRYYTPEEDLALERAAEYKSEYVGGEIFAMTGTSVDHNTIAGNILRLLGNQFQGRPCRVFMSDLRVQVAATGMYIYPDVIAVCGPLEFAGGQRDTLFNPTVIVEILSPSTELYDRGAKFDHYARLPSLTEYVLVAQDQMRVEHFTRQGDGWLLTEVDAPDDILRLPVLDAALPLVAIYEHVEFPAPAGPNPPAPFPRREGGDG
jgi:Uma2 family endonuclease